MNLFHEGALPRGIFMYDASKIQFVSITGNGSIQPITFKFAPRIIIYLGYDSSGESYGITCKYMMNVLCYSNFTYNIVGKVSEMPTSKNNTLVYNFGLGSYADHDDHYAYKSSDGKSIYADDFTSAGIVYNFLGIS